MIFNWISKRRGAARGAGLIGLEFAQQAVNAVQLGRQASGKVTLEASSSVPYPDTFQLPDYSSKDFHQLLSNVFQGKQFSGRKVNTTMPASEIRIISVNYISKKGQSEAEAITNVVSERFDGELGNHIVDYLPVRNENKSGSSMAIVALAEKNKVIAYPECLRKCGLEVQGLEVGPSAITRLIASLHKPTEAETVLVVNFGWQKSFLSVVSGRRLLFDSGIDFGEEMILAQLEHSLAIDRELARQQIEKHGLGKLTDSDLQSGKPMDETVAITIEEIVRAELLKITHSIRRSAIYASSVTHGTPLSKVYLLGSLARWRGVDRIFAELLDMEVTLIPNPLIAFGPDGSERSRTPRGQQRIRSTDSRPELAVATGLALKGIQVHV